MRVRANRVAARKLHGGTLAITAVMVSVMLPSVVSADVVAGQITSVSPAATVLSSPSAVTITGTNFTRSVNVLFNGVPGTSVSVSSDGTTITVTPPAASVAGPAVVDVQNTDGTTTVDSTNTSLLCYAPSGAPILSGGPNQIEACGTQLWLNGAPDQLHGFDAYSLGTDWGLNQGCGGDFRTIAAHQTFASGINTFFSSLPAGSIVRFDAFQTTIGEDRGTSTVDWTPLDTVFTEAAANNIYLIPVLANEWGSCDDGETKDLAWYNNTPGDGYGYAASGRLLSASGILETPAMSYQSWVSTVVSRYASSPALGMWEPIGEPEADTCLYGPVGSFWQCNHNAGASCNSTQQAAATGALVSFFNTIGGLIHSIDPSSLVEEGLLGGGQCGSSGLGYAKVGASSGIDVLSYHNYSYDGKVTLPTDGSGTILPGGYVSTPSNNYNNAPERLLQAGVVNKPIVDSEFGMTACGPTATTSTTGSFIGCGVTPSSTSTPAAISGVPLISGAACYVGNSSSWATLNGGTSYYPGVSLTQRASYVQSIATSEFSPPTTTSWQAPVYSPTTGAVTGLAQPTVGISMFLEWDFNPGATSTCSYNVQPNDPVISVVNSLP